MLYISAMTRFVRSVEHRSIRALRFVVDIVLQKHRIETVVIYIRVSPIFRSSETERVILSIERQLEFRWRLLDGLL